MRVLVHRNGQDERAGKGEHASRADHVRAEGLARRLGLDAARPASGPALIGGDQWGGLVRHLLGCGAGVSVSLRVAFRRGRASLKE